MLADDDHKLIIEKDRGAKAQALLDNPLLAEAFETLEALYIEAWKTNGVSMTGDDTIPRRLDAEGRDRMWQMVQVVGKVKTHLEAIVRDGEVAHRLLAESAQNDT